MPFESIPEKVINSFLSAEDKNFFSHPGVDAKGILRALIKNIQNIYKDKRLEGFNNNSTSSKKFFIN